MVGYKGKYTKSMIQYSLLNDRIVIYNRPNLPMIRVDAIWDNPYSVSDLLCSGAQSENCDFWTKEYPCTNEILQMIIEYIPKAFDKQPEDVSVPVSEATDKMK